ncbi:MAG: hypothetical protein AAGL08_07265 [Cyanobacteria bacterium J06573_11]
MCKRQIPRYGKTPLDDCPNPSFRGNTPAPRTLNEQESAQSFLLQDGRHLAYQAVGAPDKRHIFYAQKMKQSLVDESFREQ